MLSYTLRSYGFDEFPCRCGPASEELARPRGQLLTTALKSSGFVPTRRLKFPLGPYVFTEMEKRVPAAEAADAAEVRHWIQSTTPAAKMKTQYLPAQLMS